MSWTAHTLPALLSMASLHALAQYQRPNVILIVADDLGYADLSCYGAKGVKTPAVDRLAQRGLRFTDAHCVASTSTPSRYGMLTGCYPFRKPNTNVAAGNAGMIITPDQYTLADLFHDQGYKTGAIGKWHLGLGSKTGEQNWNAPLDAHLADIGFDYSYIMAATADRVPCVFIENGRVANYDPSSPIEVSYQKAFEGVKNYKDYRPEELKLRSSHGHDYSVVNGIGRIGWMKGGGKALWEDENIADSITSHALRFINENRQDPFFLYLATNDVHVPRYPHERFRGKSPMGLRGDAILQFDWTVECVTQELERLGLTENTLIILTSDNGPVLDDGYQDRAIELAGEHRPGGIFRGGKYSAFEAGSTVPFIVSWPGHIKQGKESKSLVSQIDFMGSLAQLIGGNVPEGHGTDTRNQLTTWLGKSKADAPYALSMAASRSLTLRTKRWKYIAPCNGEPIISWGPAIETGYLKTPQLFDYKKDPGETRNVAEQNASVVTEIEGIIEGIVKK